jgi:LmbE family N-acetylglucosaminyl deacetylase
MKVLVAAPHPDDETLGCGGALSRLRRERPDAEIHWVIFTEMAIEWGFSRERIAQRNEEIEAVRRMLQPTAVHRLGFRPAHLRDAPLADVIAAIAAVMDKSTPDVVLVPWRHDTHTDHGVVFDAVTATVKTFRRPSVRTVLAYETVSETDFALDPAVSQFRPNFWIDITSDLDSKLKLLACYSSEIGKFPFPRSVETVTALARVRGSAAGVHAAEAFHLLKGII